MTYTMKYTKALFNMIYEHEQIIKQKYDGEIYNHVQNMRSEYRFITENFLESQSIYIRRSRFGTVKGSYKKSDWKPIKTIVNG